MPQHKSPMKRMKTDAKRQARNNYVRRTIKTLEKKIRTDMTDEERQALLNDIYSQLDKAAKKGVIHKRTASRRKARVAAFVNKTQKAKSE
ncbi:MAG: 30S ribosomal protein S20 [Candidatus Cloacimonadaceae bacterium]|jgi:small subunit ribosomal protein S20|nr:30S ribosomal protein S20 [Candidatus Cloacimonadota bacterium]MCB5257765.1 30S ribosomal protein S20 [Candidatus Cloacimonadota bacterium]MDD5624750.1 30S ribosomal protein S20 [Candidatus Cloacimonadota bacterium]MDY0111689.1 30S ribosomal protein S20 [Candidatus Syntrophosphaera sp.]